MMTKELLRDLQRLRRDAAKRLAKGGGQLGPEAADGGLRRDWVVLGEPTEERPIVDDIESREEGRRARRRS